jgi:hypothetical protein
MELNTAKQIYFTVYRKLVELGMSPSAASKRVRSKSLFTKLLHDQFKVDNVDNLVDYLLKE